MTTFDVDAIRSRFPALSLTHDGRQMAFFDGPGGTQVPDSVIEAVTRYYRESNANHGGTFPTSRRSDAIVDDAHAALADLLGVDADEITLGPNMTTLTFHISRSIAASFRPGDEIVVSGPRSPGERRSVDRGGARQRGDRPHLGAESRRLHAPPGGPRPAPQRAHEARRGRLGVERGRHDQPGRRGGEARARRRGVGVRRRGPRRAAPAARRPGGRRGLRRLLGLQVLRAARRRALRPARDRATGSRRTRSGPACASLRDRHRQLRGLRRRARRRSSTSPTSAFGTAARLPTGVATRAACRPAWPRSAAYETDLYRHLAARLGAINGVTIVGLTADADMERRTPTAAITIEGVTPARRGGAPRRSGHRRLGRRLLRHGAHGAPGPRAGRRRPDRPDPLQHAGRGRPPRRRARGARRLGLRASASGSCRSSRPVAAPTLGAASDCTTAGSQR